MASIRVVTDGGADVPDDLAASLGIDVVRGPVRFGEDRWSGSRADFWQRVEARGPVPSTAPPTVDDFINAFDGDRGVCAVLASAELSRTYDHAVEAAGRVECDVRIVDSRSLSVGTALLALTTAQAAEISASTDELEKLAHRLADQAHVYAVIEDVQYLLRGGRAGLLDAKHVKRRARHVVAIKGHAIPLAQARSREGAICELVDHISGHVHHTARRWAVAHGDAPDVDDFAARLQGVMGREPEYVTPLGPSVGTHAGPGALVVGFLADR